MSNNTILQKKIKEITDFYYVKKINELGCYFNNSGKSDGHYDIFKFSKEFSSPLISSIKTSSFYRDIIEGELTADIQDMNKKAQNVISNTRNITYNGERLGDSIKTVFKNYTEEEFETPQNQKESEFNYKIVPDLIESIITLKNKLSEMKEKYSYDSIISKIPDVEDIYIETNIEAAFDTSYGYHLQNSRVMKKTKHANPVSIGTVGKGLGGGLLGGIVAGPLGFATGGGAGSILGSQKLIEFELPSKSELLKVIGNYKMWLVKGRYTAYENKCVVNKAIDKSPVNKEEIDKVTGAIGQFITECDDLVSKLRKITSKYSNMEKSSKKKYINGLRKSLKNGISKKKSEIDVEKLNNKYKKLQLVVGEEKASKWLQKQIKKTGAKVCLADGVISIVKKKASADKKKKKSSSKSSKSSKSSNATTSMAATGATVVATKVRKSTKAKTTKKARKTTSKDEKTKKMKGKVAGNTKKGVVTTVSTLASLQAAKKQLQNNTTVKLSNIRTEAANKIADIEGKAEDQKKLAEIEKNNTIKKINEDAANKISAIDPNDSEANTKIEQIKTEAEEAISKAEEKFESNVNDIEEKKNQDVTQIENSRENDLKSVEDKSNQELEEINSDIEKAQKTKSSKKSTKTTETKSSEATETKVETKEYKSTVSDNDVETSEKAAEDSSTKLNDAIDSKQNEITAVEQAKENTNNGNDGNTGGDDNNTGGTVAQPESTPASEQSTPANVDTDTSSNYTNSYNADDSYSASDYNAVEEQKQADINSSNTGVDQSTLKSDSTIKSTFDIKKDTTTSSSTSSSKKDIDDISSISSSTSSSSSKKSSGLGAAVPIGLGIAATGAAAVAGVRYVKNKKLNEDYDENYDDENNDVYSDEIPSDSAYMADDYLGPEGSSYTEVPNDNEYTDAEALEEEAGTSDFSEDAALNELN